MECVAYMRVSTEKQAEEGNGLDSQKRDIELFAGKMNWLYLTGMLMMDIPVQIWIDRNCKDLLTTA